MKNLLVGCTRRSPGFLERYLQAVEAVRLENPKEALEMAETGLQIAAQISRDTYGYSQCQLTIAKAWGALGGTLRAVNRLEEAESAYRTAACYLNWANANKTEKALLCRRLAFLRKSQGRYAESKKLLNTAIQFYRSERQTNLLGQAFADMGRTLQYENGDPRTTEQYLRHALEYLPETEHAYLLSTRFSLLGLYCEHGSLGEPKDLLGLVQDLRNDPLCTEGSSVEASVLLLEGTTLNRAGLHTESIQALERSRQLFLHHDAYLNAAVAAMELALVWLQQGQYDECQRLAGELFPIYKSLKRDQEAAAALTLFMKSSSEGHLNIAITRQVLRCLHSQSKLS